MCICPKHTAYTLAAANALKKARLESKETRHDVCRMDESRDHSEHSHHAHNEVVAVPNKAESYLSLMMKTSDEYPLGHINTLTAGGFSNCNLCFIEF